MARVDRSGLWLSAGTLAVLALVFAIVELSLRSARPDRCRRWEDEKVTIHDALEHLSPCFHRERRAGEPYLVRNASLRRDDPSTAFPSRRTPGVPRLAIVGESTGWLIGRAIDELVGHAPLGHIEVLQCADPGMTLSQVERRFDEVMDDQPDAVIVIFGHNLMFEVPTDELGLKARRWVRESCLLSELLPGKATQPSVQLGLAPRLDAFEAAVRRMAARARADKRVLVGATMAGNLRLAPAFEAAEESDPAYLEAVYLEASGARAAAIGALREALAHAQHPLWHYQLGEWLLAAGEAEPARRELQAALDGDRDMIRASSMLNDRWRKLAAEGGFRLRDSDRAFRESAPGGLPGWESFHDNCHPWPPLCEREAEALVEEFLAGVAADGAPVDDLRRLPLLLAEVKRWREGGPTRPSVGFAPSWQAGRRDEQLTMRRVFEMFAPPGGLDGRWYRGMARFAAQALRDDPVDGERQLRAFLDGDELRHADERRRALFLVALADGERLAGRAAEAAALNEQACHTSLVEPWVQKGLLHLRAGRTVEAQAAFAEALRREPARADARYFANRLSRRGN